VSAEVIHRANIAIHDNDVYIAGANITAPATLEEARASEEWPLWNAECINELTIMEEMRVFSKVKRSSMPLGMVPVECRCVFAYKFNPDGSISRRKARLFAKGYSQRRGLNYTETWAPTGHIAILRLLLALAAQLGWIVLQIDIKSAFLNGKLSEKVYMEQPPGYGDNTNSVLLLHRAIYGLKQAAREWHSALRSQLDSMGYRAMHADPGTFVYGCALAQTAVYEAILRRFIYTHVDDCALIGLPAGVQADADAIISEYEGKNMGEPKVLLGLHIERDWAASTVSISQPTLIGQVVRRLGQEDSAPSKHLLPGGYHLHADTYPHSLSADKRAQFPAIVGCLLYIACMTRPDICFTVTALARFLTKPTSELYGHAINVLRYLKGTRKCKLVFGGSRTLPPPQVPPPVDTVAIVAYSDSDFANCKETRRSVTGFVITVNGTPFLWASRKPPYVTKSSCAAEYVAASACTDEVLLTMKACADIGFAIAPVPLCILNQATMKIFHDPIRDTSSKYIALHHHVVRERVRNRQVQDVWVETGDQLADVLTKALPGPAMAEVRERLVLLET
jgi:hypothetical protein